LEPALRERDGQLISKRADNRVTIILYLFPSLVLFGIFVYYPLGYNLFLSFTSWNFLSPQKNFVGLQNFITLFSRPIFWRVLGNTTTYAVATVALSLLIGLLLALLLNNHVPGRGVFRTIFFAPYITTITAMSLLWIWIYEPTYGILNYALKMFSIEGPRWLTDSHWAMASLVIMSVWKESGYAMVIYLAGLTNIDNSLYEAAKIDGASKWLQLRKITLPLLTPTTFFLMITSLLNAFKAFDQVAVMTAGGPVNATTNLSYFIYQQAFQNFKAGYASSAAVVFFVILLVLTLIQLKLQGKWVHYEQEYFHASEE
jgi:ABC-type sugar transport system permease subunit